MHPKLLVKMIKSALILFVEAVPFAAGWLATDALIHRLLPWLH
jgi:hypothetical protein